ncbi:MAG: hypothetical protein NVSMB39_4180 [Candidatus Saccharimonadales bacterium]
MFVINNFGDTASQVVKLAMDSALNRPREQVTTGDLLLAFTMLPDCEAAIYLNSFGINGTCSGQIEAQIIMAGDLPKQKTGVFTTELTLAFLIASKMPARFGNERTTDLQLLTALFCDFDQHNNQIFTINTNRRVALDALAEMGVDMLAFKKRLLPKLVHIPFRRQS